MGLLKFKWVYTLILMIADEDEVDMMEAEEEEDGEEEMDRNILMVSHALLLLGKRHCYWWDVFV